MKKIAFAFIAFILALFVSCSGGDDKPDCEEDGSCGGFNNSSSSIGGGNSSGGGGNSSGGGGGGSSSSTSGGNQDGSWTGWPFNDDNENLGATPSCPSYSGSIEIKYNNGSEPEITDSYGSGVSVSKDGENVTVNLTGTTEYHLVLSGTAQNGSLKVFAEERIGLSLNGVRITNGSGPAISIQESRRVNVCLASGTENYLEGESAEAQGDEQAKGTFFSEEKLSFLGNGTLEVKARKGHAIVVDNDFEIENGKIIIRESAGDGIHANDRIEIKGGVIKIASTGDALQSERDSVVISGGKFVAKTTGVKSHGISSEGATSIKGNAKIQISVLGNGSKGIKSTNYTEIMGGTTDILTKGEQDRNDADTSTAAGMKVDADLFVEGGSLTIKSEGNKSKGINAANIDMINGNLNIEADDDGIKVHGVLKISGGTINVKSLKKKAIDGTLNKTGGAVVNETDGGF